LNTYAICSDIEPYGLYVSESFLKVAGTPKLNFEKNSNLKWFEKNTALISSGRTEISLKNFIESYTLAYRNQNLNGIHNGRGAKFECLSGFCSWVDTSIISGIDKSEQINYRINLHQIWVEKAFENSNYSIGLIAGINVIDIDLNVSNSFQNYHRSQTVPIPFFGASTKYKLNEKLYLVLNIHHFEAQKNNLNFAFNDSEIELNLDLTKYLRVSIGNNIAYLNFQNKTQNSNTQIYVPQNSSYIKFTFIY
jgi:hypothetical protein